jgi:hypothetical protein
MPDTCRRADSGDATRCPSYRAGLQGCLALPRRRPDPAFTTADAVRRRRVMCHQIVEHHPTCTLRHSRCYRISRQPPEEFGDTAFDRAVVTFDDDGTQARRQLDGALGVSRSPRRPRRASWKRAETCRSRPLRSRNRDDSATRPSPRMLTSSPSIQGDATRASRRGNPTGSVVRVTPWS